MRPLFDTNNAAAVLFWPVFVGWAAFEWLPMIRERRQRPEPRTVRSPDGDRSGLILVGLLYIGLVVAYLATETVTAAAVPGSQALWFAAGITLMVAGLGLRYWAIRTLGRWFTRRLAVAEDQTVVSAGPYGLVRHPSYLGGFITCIGFGLAVTNLVSIIAMFACASFGFSHPHRRRTTAAESTTPAGRLRHVCRTTRSADSAHLVATTRTRPALTAADSRTATTNNSASTVAVTAPTGFRRRRWGPRPCT